VRSPEASASVAVLLLLFTRAKVTDNMLDVNVNEQDFGNNYLSFIDLMNIYKSWGASYGRRTDAVRTRLLG
jgi:hypothetical protein